MITASKAKEIAEKSDPNLALTGIMNRIEAAAKEGKYSIQVREFGFGGGEYYAPSQDWPTMGKEVIAELRKNGFKAEIRDECRQFVDVWLEVSWA